MRWARVRSAAFSIGSILVRVRNGSFSSIPSILSARFQDGLHSGTGAVVVLPNIFRRVEVTQDGELRRELMEDNLYNLGKTHNPHITASTNHWSEAESALLHFFFEKLSWSAGNQPIPARFTLDQATKSRFDQFRSESNITRYMPLEIANESWVLVVSKGQMWKPVTD